MTIFRVDPNNPAPQTDEETLSSLSQTETESFARIPTVDISAFSQKKDWFKLTGQGFMESLVQQGLDTFATTFILAGRLEQEKKKEKYGPDPFLIAEIEGQKFMYDPAKENVMIRVGEKIRNVGLALRKRIALDEANRVQPEGFGEEVLSGIGSGAGSVLGLILSTFAGAAAGTVVAPGIGTVIGGVGVGMLSSALNEKTMMAQELMKAGYSARATEKISNWYGAVVGGINYLSLGQLGGFLRPTLFRAAKGAIMRRILVGATEGLLTEGPTEALQQRIQTEVEIATKLKERNFQEDLTDDLLAFVVGSAIGSPMGAAGQLRHRRETIDRIVKQTGLNHSTVAGLVDEAFLRANESVYDVLIDHYDISEDVAWIDRAFKKIEGKSELGPMPERVDETMPDEYRGYEALLEAVQTDEKAKSLPKKIGKLRDDIRAMEAVRQGLKDEDAQIAQKKLDELGAELEKTKQENIELFEKNPKLVALLAEGDALIEEHKTADPARKLEIEQRVDDISFALQNPGSVQAAVKAAEAKVEALEGKAREQYEKLVQLESGPAQKEANKVGGERAHLEAELTKTVEAELTKTVEALLRAERQLGGMETIAERLKGNVALTSGQVRIAMRQQLRQILNAYVAGRKFSEQDLKSIQKAFRVLLKGSSLSRRSAVSMLRSVLTIRAPEQFNEKIGVIVGHINSIIRSETVGEYQNLGKEILDQMKTSKGKVTPEAQVLAEHLRRVFRGQVPQVYEGGEGNVTDLVNAQVEQAVYDLANSEDDVVAAKHALEILRGYYENKLQKFQDFKKAQKETYARIAGVLEKQVTKDVKFDELKAAFDSTRQKDKRKNMYRMTPYDTAVMSILNELDNASGAKNMEGPLVKEFDSNRSFQTMVVLRHQAKEWVEGKMLEAYGPQALKLWLNTRTKDFLDVPFAPLEEGGDPRSVNVSKAGAMSLYLMTKMPGVYNELLRMGVDEAWLEQFKNGDNVGFTKEDYKYMAFQREALDWMAEKIAPVYERLTGKPFRRVDNYFMTVRYLFRSLEAGGVADTTPVIDEMLSGDFDRLDPTDVDSLKPRTKSKALFDIPDIFEAMSFYMQDMVHFVAFADQAVKYREVFGNQRVRKILSERLPKGFLAVIDDHIKMLVSGSVDRSSDRRAMGWAFKLLGNYARNQISTPKNFLRQITGVAAAMDLDGASPAKLAEAIWDLPRAIKSGELKQLTDTSYMQERLAGLYEMAVLYVQEMTRTGDWQKRPFNNPWWTNKQIHDFFTSAPRYGDRMASIAVGWMIYRDRMSRTLTPRDVQKIAEIRANQPKLSDEEAHAVYAVQEGIDAIDATQQSMDSGKLPIVASRSDLPSRLLTLFQRATMQYFDRYMNAHRMYAAKRISTKQFIRSMLVYHVYIPILEVAVTAGDWEPWETALAMIAGPFSYHVIIGQAVRAMIAGLIEGISDNEADLPFYLKDVSNTHLIGSMTRDVIRFGKEIAKALDETINNGPDFETMWSAAKAGAKVAEIKMPYPTGYLARAAEGVYDVFMQGPEEMMNSIKKIAGWPESRTKSEE